MKSKKISFFQIFSIYTFWFVLNSVIAFGSWGVALVLQSNSEWVFITAFLISLLLQFCTVLILGRRKAKSRVDWLLLSVNLISFFIFSILLQPNTLHEWIPSFFLVSMSCPFFMQLYEMILDCKVIMDLTQDARKNTNDVLDSMKTKKNADKS